MCILCLCSIFEYIQAETASSTSSSVESLSMPTITAPTMPTITVPTFDDNPGTTTTTTTTNEDGTTTTKTSSKNTNTTSSNSNSTTKTDTDTTADSLEIPLTAKDISELNSIGAFNDKNISDSLTNNTNSPDSLLKNLLTKLTALKTDQKDKLKNLENEPEKQKNIQQKENITNSILRFTINGYDITGSFKTIYFSKPTTDGSFLFTGDRKYFSSGKAIKETFYLLFTSKGNNGGVISYTVTPTLFQQWNNPYSFFYRLKQKKDLIAQKTGNLVTLHVTDSDLKVDLLLNINK